MWKCKEWWNINLTLCIWCGTLSQHPLPPTRCHPHQRSPSTQTISQEKTKFWKKNQTLTNCMVLPWPTYTKLGLREAQTPCPKLHALQRIKLTAQTLPNQGMLMRNCKRGAVKSKYKTKSNVPSQSKSEAQHKIYGQFLVFPNVIKRSYCSKRVTTIKAWYKNKYG